jgi:hypothetical protein|nr:MAG TPA: hypothetical protein [Caudoviricetes sp.]
MATFEEIVPVLKNLKMVILDGIEIPITGILIVEDISEDLILTPIFGNAANLACEADLDEDDQPILVSGKHSMVDINDLIIRKGDSGWELPRLWKFSQFWEFKD